MRGGERETREGRRLFKNSPTFVAFKWNVSHLQPLCCKTRLLAVVSNFESVLPTKWKNKCNGIRSTGFLVRVEGCSLICILKDKYDKFIIFLLFVYFNAVTLLFRLTYSTFHEFWSCKEVSCLRSVFDEMFSQERHKYVSTHWKFLLQHKALVSVTEMPFLLLRVCVCRSDVSKRSNISTTKSKWCQQQLYVGRCYFCVR